MKNRISRRWLDDEAVKRLADMLERYNLIEIDYALGPTRIRLRKKSGENETDNFGKTYDVNNGRADGTTKDAVLDYSTHPGAIRSQMIGTCYLSPSPGKANYIQIGQQVNEGQPLLIIEAMKVMNVIRAPRAGRVIHIAITEQAPVEFGQLLVVIE
ncbi:MAG: hypothetical protein LBF56_00935 [Holosporales bacterium]|jgi:acetyl-CoA carboxylase biotin carboxyl carrier protein|nr:hypothetical protein [Holosporales bacterium]